MVRFSGSLVWARNERCDARDDNDADNRFDALDSERVASAVASILTRHRADREFGSMRPR